jgi:hypothetical protein
LIKRLPKPPQGSGYHVFLDNLFVYIRIIKYICSQGISITSTCGDNTGVIQEFLDLKKKDKKDIIKWGETYYIPTENNQVCYIRWKDQVFVLIISSVLLGNKRVTRLRKKLKETFSKAKTTRVPFGKDPEKELEIPVIADTYNYQIRAINKFDHLIAQNTSLCYMEPGGGALSTRILAISYGPNQLLFTCFI